MEKRKLERVIIKSLYRRKSDLGNLGLPVKEIAEGFALIGKKRNELFNAIRRLERRNIVRILIL